jgi:hypothetical protein
MTWVITHPTSHATLNVNGHSHTGSSPTSVVMGAHRHTGSSPTSVVMGARWVLSA